MVSNEMDDSETLQITQTTQKTSEFIVTHILYI